jgi:hypothetical protein
LKRLPPKNAGWQGMVGAFLITYTSDCITNEISVLFSHYSREGH